MRNQQIPTGQVRAFYPKIAIWCKDSAAGCKFNTAGHPKEVRMCLTAKECGGALGSTGQLSAKSSSGHLYSSTECKQHQDSSKEKVLLAQPAFVLENKERPFKRHAAELVLKSENGLDIYPEKRARSSSFTYRSSHSPTSTDYSESEKRRRSSSFTFLPTFPAVKNNIFLPTALLKEHTEGAIPEQERLHDWNVIKPASLQPPNGHLYQGDKVTWSGTAVQRWQAEDKPSSLEQNSTPIKHADKPKFALEPTSNKEVKTSNQSIEKTFMHGKSAPDFVFGENMDKRVKRPQGSAESQTSLKLVNPSASGKQPPLSSWPYQKDWVGTTSLIESAEAYTSKPSLKYTLDKVEVITGEESERNVLQVNCKLFTLSKDTQMWVEKGRGYLRLNDSARNDSGMFKSRIVMRNLGNLKLIMNSKIWDQMKLERLSRKNLCITATDLGDQSLKVFLIQASVKDAGRLYAAIHHRLVALRSSKNQVKDTATYTETERDANMQLLQCDSEDEDEMTSFHSKSSDHFQRMRRRPILHS